MTTTDQEDAAKYRSLLAEAAQILPTPVSEAVSALYPQWASGRSIPQAANEVVKFIAKRDLLHLARRDAGFAALRAALDSIAWHPITERESGQEYELCEECRAPKGDSHKASCVVGAALATTEPGAALKTVIEALTTLRDTSNPGDASEPISAQTVFEQSMKALRALGVPDGR